MIMKKVLTIAGTDPTGGAGVQADLKTMTAHKVYGMSIITALVAQNTLGVRDIMEVKPDFLAEQFDCVFEDIYPDAIKIGMVSSPVLIEMIVNKLTSQKDCPIVVDPVMVSTSGSRLLADNALRLLKEKLIPLATIILMLTRLGQYFLIFGILLIPLSFSVIKSVYVKILLFTLVIFITLYDYIGFFNDPTWIEKYSVYKTFFNLAM